ncbi:MAG: tRNA uridine-5-carboxymethylaminomethyl(34) synthesis GTPase MnmE, partial [Clostridia bacterium]|nr:tRNA uridine-5-carboxymethylaminomethyl(34) synthesis GTPase MnmE [Clostridia bacterium]
VALLRISGTDAITICERVFLPKSGKKLSEYAPRTAVFGSICAPDDRGEWNEIDDGLATVFRAPASFTGEDTVEICCHGGILLSQTVLTACLAAGARAAEAGEFTRRAFLNGKMGLSAAEALGDLLEAQTREQLTLAHAGTDGRVERKCLEIYDALCAVLSSVYAKIDYPDEDLAEMSREEMDAALADSIVRLEKLLDTYRTGHAIAEGIPTVICGKPNVGKSSLYNRIVGRDAAIVTDVEGTTRDVLTETAALGRVTLRLFDTAGLRRTEDVVEKIGIDRARKALEDAELILAVFDGSVAPDEEDEALATSLSNTDATVIAVINKSDLGIAEQHFYTAHFSHTVTLSAKEGEGTEELSALVESCFINGELDTKTDTVLTNARQKGAALSALEALKRAREGLALGLPVELCCSDCESAMQAIAELDGRAVSEDIVSHIFSHFCVGK